MNNHRWILHIMVFIFILGAFRRSLISSIKILIRKKLGLNYTRHVLVNDATAHMNMGQAAVGLTWPCLRP